MTTTPKRVLFPSAPQPRKPQVFPLLAFFAPVFAAAMMWAVTRSMFVLVFAVLGPVIALATMGDSRRRNRAEERQDATRFEAEFAIAMNDIERAHDHERAKLERETPSSRDLAATHLRDSERWRGSTDEKLLVRLGVGRIASQVQLDGDPTTGPNLAPRESFGKRSIKRSLPSTEELYDRAKYLDNAPVVVDARQGVGVCGNWGEAASLAVSLVAQLASILSPKEFELKTSFTDIDTFQWVLDLPHAGAGTGDAKAGFTKFAAHSPVAQFAFQPIAGGEPITVCVSEDDRLLPRECRVVAAVSGSGASLTRHPEGFAPAQFRPDYLSKRQAIRLAGTLRDAALISWAKLGGALPERVRLSEITATSLGTSRGTNLHDRSGVIRRGCLKTAIGIGVEGQIALDLVSDGPHAIVGGTTGSGKSEVLVTWVLALAAEYRPIEVNFLLIDFKGGAAFAPVANLPHTVGVLTDLDPATAGRAMLSLQAELRRREQILADSQARSIVELSPSIELPRLVIVVDEFAAMTASFPAMQGLFADLAARGRSLGIHLILCTQQPSGSIRESILANCALRVSLRVNNSIDSVAVVGISEAAKIPKNLPGRGYILRSGAVAEAVQWAVSSEADALAVTKVSLEHALPVWRPWLDPLPPVLSHASVPPAALPRIAFGLVDIPEEQRQESAIYNPELNGNLFIVGSRQSGKSTTIAMLSKSASNAIRVPVDAEGAWDAVSDVLSQVRTGAGSGLVLLDDLDLILGKLGQDYELAFVERLVALMREGPRCGTTVVLAASSTRGRVQAISGLCDSTLILQMRDRQDHLLAGGAPVEYSGRLPPGAGYWNGHLAQVCVTEPLLPIADKPLPRLSVSPGGVLAIVSTHPTALHRELAAIGQTISLDNWRTNQGTPALEISRGEIPLIVIGDPDNWLSSLALFGALRASGPAVFHNCSPAEFRSLTRIRELPPPLNSPQTSAIILHPDGRISRAKVIS